MSGMDLLAAAGRFLACLGLMLLNGVVLILMLRKVLGHLHLRLGPTYLGPRGMFQTLADVLKLFTKEDPTPTNVDRSLYFLAPAAVFIPSLMAYAALPFSDSMVAADLENGLLYTFAVLALVPIGILMAGWSSSNKWSLIGGMRAVSQQVAYEVPLLLATIPIVMTTSSLNLGDIVKAQSGLWNVVPQFPAFVIFFIAALVETNQTPFDLSEAESELIGGFATEYASMKFGLLFLSEFSNTFVMSALTVTLFFGGWQGGFGIIPAPVVFMFKTYLMIFVLMWIRGTMPRVRIDHMMSLAWKILMPASIAWILVVGLVMKLADVVKAGS